METQRGGGGGKLGFHPYLDNRLKEEGRLVSFPPQLLKPVGNINIVHSLQTSDRHGKLHHKTSKPFSGVYM